MNAENPRLDVIEPKSGHVHETAFIIYNMGSLAMLQVASLAAPQVHACGTSTVLAAHITGALTYLCQHVQHNTSSSVNLPLAIALCLQLSKLQAG